MYTETLINQTRHELVACLTTWRMPETSRISLLTMSENLTFLAEDAEAGRRIIIRVHRPDYHCKEEIESELAWIDDLRTTAHVNTPAPVMTTTGSPVLTISADGQSLHVVAFEHAAGREPDIDEGLPQWFERLGAVNATLHEHSRRWQPPVGFVRKRWDLESMISPRGLWGDWRNAPGMTAVEAATIHDAIVYLKSEIALYGTAPERFGLVHADLRLTNLLVSRDSMTIIDFDDCGFCWYAYDFAAAISFHETDPSVPQLRDAWIKGYRSVAEFSAADEAMLDTFVMLRRILLCAWLATHQESKEGKMLSEGFSRDTAGMARRYVEQRRGRSREGQQGVLQSLCGQEHDSQAKGGQTGIDPQVRDQTVNDKVRMA